MSADEHERLRSDVRASYDRVAEEYARRIDPIPDMRGTSWYRTEMVKVWVRRAILHAGMASATRPATA